MEEQYQKLHREEAPFSYFRGSEPVMGCFATSGVLSEVTSWRHTTRLEVWKTTDSNFMAAHHASGSVGDHRLHVIDFCAVSILGAELPAVTRQEGRRLQYKLRPTRRKYLQKRPGKDVQTTQDGGEVTCDDASRELLDRDGTQRSKREFRQTTHRAPDCV